MCLYNLVKKESEKKSGLDRAVKVILIIGAVASLALAAYIFIIRCKKNMCKLCREKSGAYDYDIDDDDDYCFDCDDDDDECTCNDSEKCDCDCDCVSDSVTEDSSINTETDEGMKNN